MDLFGNILQSKSVKVNIYADEIQPVKDEITKEKWFYIGIIVEDLDYQLLDDIISVRHCNNFDKNSPYYAKNDRTIHWSEITDIDTKNIAKRWIDYILNPENKNKFYAYVLGINVSKLNREEFDTTNEFNSQYNRFFRSAILYGLKCFFGNREIIVKNIFHEEGQQQNHHYFPWHCIYKIQEQEENISFELDNLIFLPKDHRKDKRSNIIQLCDLLLGLCKTTLHGIEESKASRYKKELLDKFFPLLTRMVRDPYNKNSQYAHYNRIMIRFFPKEKTDPEDLKRFVNQFYTHRRLIYEEKLSGQCSLFLIYKLTLGGFTL